LEAVFNDGRPDRTFLLTKGKRFLYSQGSRAGLAIDLYPSKPQVAAQSRPAFSPQK